VRLLASPEFSGKISALSVTDIQRVSQFVERIKVSDKEALTVDAAVAFLESSVYVAKLGQTRLYFTIGNDPDGEYVLLLDASAQHDRPYLGELFTPKNPKTNVALNPRLNFQINPTLNQSLNPMWNQSINPAWNQSINPAWNQSINPAWNQSINPAWNQSINPSWNHSINPAWNHSINPTWNRAFGGPYIYSKDLEKEGYLVRANDQVEVLFDLSGAHIGELVKANDKVRLQFDKKCKWVAYAVRANDDVALLFSKDAKWEGQIII
jgi:hypothetical protein